MSLNDDGSLLISGQDLQTFAGEEYEYALTVARDDVAKVAAALGGPDTKVITLLVENADDVVTVGELTWLRSIGVEPAFWSRRG